MINDDELTQFNQQLLLKLTLGQNFKQALTIPAPLRPYLAEDADIQTINQLWVLIQQAGIQAQPASEAILQQLTQLTATPATVLTTEAQS